MHAQSSRTFTHIYNKGNEIENPRCFDKAKECWLVKPYRRADKLLLSLNLTFCGVAMIKRRNMRISPFPSWTSEQETALDVVRAAGYVPLEDAIFQLHESMWRNAPVANEVR